MNTGTGGRVQDCFCKSIVKFSIQNIRKFIFEQNRCKVEEKRLTETELKCGQNVAEQNTR